jgi:PII-like signaling protein
VTVLRGIMGYGSSSKVHTESILRLSMDLPIVVEVVEEEATLQRLLPELDGMIGGGLVTMERAQVVMYRPAKPPVL